MKKEEKILSYKGFNFDEKGLYCQPSGKSSRVDYKVGKSYKTDKASCCKLGFHACEEPLAVFGYYAPACSKFALVEQSGKLDRDGDKISSTKIKIKTELNLCELIKAQIEWVRSRTTNEKEEVNHERSGAASATGWNGAASATGRSGAASATGWNGAASATGESGAASATGESGAASATGRSGAASATGESGAASATGKSCVAMSMGYLGRAKASKGNCIVICDWAQDKNDDWFIKEIYSAKVGGKILDTKIKPDTWYWFERGVLRSNKNA